MEMQQKKFQFKKFNNIVSDLSIKYYIICRYVRARSFKDYLLLHIFFNITVMDQL